MRQPASAHRNRASRWLAAIALAALLAPAAASAQESSREGLSIAGSLGFQASPTAFLLAMEADYGLSDEISAGLAMQLGIDGDFVNVSPYVYSRWAPRMGDALGDLRPYVQGGLGLTHISPDGPVDGDTGFLMSFGIGAEYPLSQHLSIESKMLFNVIPDGVFGDNFIYTWEMASFRYRF